MTAQDETVTVRMTRLTHRKLAALATESGASMKAVLDLAVEQFRRHLFLESLYDDFARMRERPDHWNAELGERKLWDQTLADGLEED